MPGVTLWPFLRGSRSLLLVQRCGAAFALPHPSLQAWASCWTTQRKTEAWGSPAILARAGSCSCRDSSSLFPTDGGYGKGDKRLSTRMCRDKVVPSRVPLFSLSLVLPPQPQCDLGGSRGGWGGTWGAYTQGKGITARAAGLGARARAHPPPRPQHSVCFGSCSAVTAHPWRGY